MKKRTIMFLLCAGLLFSLSGCGFENEKDSKIQDLNFAVISEKDVPKELGTIINQKKSEDFQLTYEDGELYIAVGYGEQDTGGYSIEVNDLYLGENAIYLQTSLIGPQKSEKPQETKSYPYIVLKTEKRDEKVVFKN